MSGRYTAESYMAAETCRKQLATTGEEMHKLDKALSRLMECLRNEHLQELELEDEAEEPADALDDELPNEPMPEYPAELKQELEEELEEQDLEEEPEELMFEGTDELMPEGAAEVADDAGTPEGQAVPDVVVPPWLKRSARSKAAITRTQPQLFGPSTTPTDPGRNRRADKKRSRERDRHQQHEDVKRMMKPASKFKAAPPLMPPPDKVKADAQAKIAAASASASSTTIPEAADDYETELTEEIVITPTTLAGDEDAHPIYRQESFFLNSVCSSTCPSLGSLRRRARLGTRLLAHAPDRTRDLALAHDRTPVRPTEYIFRRP